MVTPAFASFWSGSTAPLLVGRFERTEEGPWFAWSGSSATVRFRGSGLSVELLDSGPNRYCTLVDGQLAREVVVTGPGRHLRQLARDLPEGEHVVTFYRLTEPMVGETQLLGFHLPAGGMLLPPPAPRGRRIEIIGDSISAGYGNEAAEGNAPWSPETENHYLTYGALAARELDADLVTIAWSGKGVSTNRGTPDPVLMPELWRYSVPQRPGSLWTFDAPPPHVVLVALGDNDFAEGVQDTSGFAGAYARFVDDVRSTYSEALILCCHGPLLSDDWPPGSRALTTVRESLEQVVRRRQAQGDTRVEVLAHAPVSEEEGYGADWHPSLATHRRMASTLVERLRARLGWHSPAVRASELC